MLEKMHEEKHECTCKLELQKQLDQLKEAERLLNEEAEWLAAKLDLYANFCIEECKEIEKDENRKDLFCIHQNGCTKTWRDFAKKKIK